MRVEIRPSIESDMDAIESDIRPADVLEMRALGTTTRDAMQQGLGLSDWALTGLLDGIPVCMFGVAPFDVLLGKGVPWMIAANGLERGQMQFLRKCRPVVGWMLESYPNLSNLVHAENAIAIKWLRWLGFVFVADPDTGRPMEFNVNGFAFNAFTQEKPRV